LNYVVGRAVRPKLIPFLLLFAIPTEINAQQPGRAESTMSDSARVYLSHALDQLQATSRHRSAPWSQIRDSAFALAAGSQMISDTYGPINWALRRVDPHSYLSARIVGANPRLLNGRVGYLWVRSYNGPAQAPLADTLQATIGRLENAGARGWIVDLRNNGGGNVWPMLAGIGPLLGDSLANISTTDGGTYRQVYAKGSRRSPVPEPPTRCSHA